MYNYLPPTPVTTLKKKNKKKKSAHDNSFCISTYVQHSPTEMFCLFAAKKSIFKWRYISVDIVLITENIALDTNLFSPTPICFYIKQA